MLNDSARGTQGAFSGREGAANRGFSKAPSSRQALVGKKTGRVLVAPDLLEIGMEQEISRE